MEDQVPQSERRSGPRKKAPGRATPASPRGGGDGKAPIEPATGAPKSRSRSLEITAEPATALGSPAEGSGGTEMEFDALASENPRVAVFGALAVGIAVGFVLGRMLSKD